MATIGIEPGGQGYNKITLPTGLSPALSRRHQEAQTIKESNTWWCGLAILLCHRSHQSEKQSYAEGGSPTSRSVEEF
jgi:hypothetical protein